MAVLHIAAACATILFFVQAPLLFARTTDLAFKLVRLPGGYTGNSITGIVQDREGFMWFGSWAGVHRYDGYQTTTYVHNPTDPASLSNGEVTALAVDGEGVVWIGTSGGGLNRFDAVSATFSHYRNSVADRVKRFVYIVL